MQTNKTYSYKKRIYYPNLTGVAKFILFSATIVLLGVTMPNHTSALTYQDNVELQFTWNPTISISLSSADLVINELSPGTSADSNTITVNVATNNLYGYTLSATAGNATNATTNLAQSGTNNKFTSIATTDSLTALTTDNTWGYSFSTNSGSNWSNYSGLPLYTAASGAELVNNDGTGSTPVQFKIAARASNEQASGAYTNVINFTAVANPEPTPQPISCDAGKICYSPNALSYEGTMAEQTASSNTSIDLLASNFSRTGYGFAGWSPTMDGTGAKYGPNETINSGDLSTSGLALYAMWVRSAGTIQNWSGCSGLASGAVTALTDSRDNNTYAVAKLADGKCWMIENLRLDNTATGNSDGSLAQGYGGQFAGLANPESPWASDSTTANSLYSTNGVDNTINIGTSNAAHRFPRYNNQNTSDRASTPTAGTNTYSYGNYYTWAAAIADTTQYSTDNQSVTGTSTCPAGWHLPIGGSSANATNSEFWQLGVATMGTAPSNNSKYQSSETNSAGKTATLAFRSYPNNFLYSGNVSSGSVDLRGSYGNYWSSTANSYYSAYYLFLDSAGVSPGTNYDSKYYGRAIRCLASS